MNSLHQKLLLAKYLFARGSLILREGGEFDAGLATSLFQDAAEIAVVACGGLANASPKEKAGFTAIWSATDEALEASKRDLLPMKVQMESLNKARIGFKHAGHRVLTQQAEEFRIDVGTFLEKVTRDYFGLEFATLSFVSLVVNEDERNLLSQSEQLIASEDVKHALECCLDVYDRIGTRQRSLYSHGILVQMQDIDPGIRSYVNAEISTLRRQIWDLEAISFAQMCGVAPMEYLVLGHLLPTKRGEQIVFEGNSELFDARSARTCVDLLARYSIGLSRLEQSSSVLLGDMAWAYLPKR